MPKRIIPVGYDTETGNFVAWEEGDELTAVQIPTDIFGRVKVSNPKTLFSSRNRHGDDVYKFQNALTGGSTSTHIPDEAGVKLSIPVTNGASAIRQTSRYFHYQSGKAQEVKCTFVLSGFDANRVFDIGQFDTQNGVFFRFSGSDPDMSVVVRDFVTGSARDTVIPRSQWNGDKLDGLGPSGITLDPTKAQIAIIEYQWLAVGSIKFALSIEGQIIVVHTQHNSNILDRVYMSTASLPLRFEVRNIGACSVVGSLLQICVEVAANGGTDPLKSESLSFSASNFTPNSITGLTLNNNDLRTLIGLRLKTTFGGIRNSAQVALLKPFFGIAVTSNQSRNAYMRILYTPSQETSTETGGTWTSVSNNSGLEYNTGITALTPSTNTISVFETAVANQSSFDSAEDILGSVALTLNIAGTQSAVFYMQCQRTDTSTTQAFGGFSWKEIQ